MFKDGIGSWVVGPCFSCGRGGSLPPTLCTEGWFPATSAPGTLHHHLGQGKCVHTTCTVCHLPVPSDFWLCINIPLKMPIPFPCPAEVSLSGEGAGRVLQSQVTAPRPTNSRPGCLAAPFIDQCHCYPTSPFWDVPTAPATELKILPCPSLFTSAGQGRTLI